MNWLHNRKIAIKIGILLAIMSLSLGGLGFTGYFYFHQASIYIDEMYSNYLVTIQTNNQARSDSNALKSAILAISAYPLDDAAKKAQLDQITAREKSIAQFIASYQATASYESERIAKASEQFKNIKDVIQKTVDLAQAGKRTEAIAYYYNNGFSQQDDFQETLRELGNYNIAKAKTAVFNDDQTIARVTLFLLILPIIIILIAILIGIVITRMITRPLKTILKNIEKVTGGDLCIEKLGMDSKDEVGLLAASFDCMISSLYNLVKEISKSSEQLSGSSEKLVAATEQNSQVSNQIGLSINEVACGTEEQVKALTRISAAIEELSAGIEEVATSSSTVADSANSAAQIAKDGYKISTRAIEQMKIVGQSTEQVQNAIDKLAIGFDHITEFIGMISNISSQTNLLALNAAIEAARAGDQGRGFAVVAEEVRKLAESSKSSASEVIAQIRKNHENINGAVFSMNDAVNSVKDGVEVVNAAGKAFADILGQVEAVSTQVHYITNVVQEMAGGSQQIVASVSEIDNVSKEASHQTINVSAAVQEQTASVEQIAHHSKRLADLAEELRSSIIEFRI